MSDVTDTRNRILDAAMEMFSEAGFKATATRAISEKAGVNEVTLFRYFGSKEKLFLEIIDREASVRMDIIGESMVPSDDLAGDLARIGEHISESMMARAGFFRLIVMEINTFPEMWEHIGTVPLAAISKLGSFFESAKAKGLVRKDVDSGIMAVSFFSFLFRILVAKAFLGDDLFMGGRKESGISEFAEIFVNGIAPREV